MVTFSAASMFFHEYPVPEIFSSFCRAGLDSMEFWPETPDFWLRDCPADDVQAARQKFPDIRTITVHAPILDLNPCSINPDVAELSIRYAIRSIDLAGQIGAGIVTVHPGRRTAKRPPGAADLKRFDHYVSALYEGSCRRDVRIAMENMEPVVNSLLCTPARMRSLLDDEPWLHFTLDVAHAMVQSAGEALRYIGLCSDRLINVHISRTDGRRVHLPLGRDPAIGTVLQALSDSGYMGALTLEIEDLNFTDSLTQDEKTAILASDLAYIKEYFP